MDEENKQTESERPSLKWVESKTGNPEIYTNFVHVNWTLFDVRFQLGLLIPVGDELNSGYVVEKRGAVTAAWPEIKQLRDLLNDVVERFEKANGEIKRPILPK